MKTTPIGAAALSLALAVAWGPAFAQSPTWSPPAEKDRCPSKWELATSEVPAIISNRHP